MACRNLQGFSKLLMKFGPLLSLLGVCIIYVTHTRTDISAAVNIKTRSIREELEYLGYGLRGNQSSLLLVTMGRTGSTFTSAIISHHQDVFLTNEPLHGEEKDIYYDDISSKTKQNALDAVDAFLTCDFRKFDAQLLQSVLFRSSKSTNDIYHCLHNSSKGRSSYDHVACFISMMHQCSQKRVHFVKSIRYRGEWLKGVLERNPRLKVLFLVRDFRATLYSQSATFKTFSMSTDGEARAKSMCTSLKKDAIQLKILSKLYPGRLSVIRYEDGCLNPVAYAQNIYSFAGLQFSEATKAYIQSLTYSNKSAKAISGKYDIERSDPVETMNKWRSKADFDLVLKMDKACVVANAIFGYMPVENIKQLKSRSFSLVKTPLLSKNLYQSIQTTKPPYEARKKNTV